MESSHWTCQLQQHHYHHYHSHLSSRHEEDTRLAHVHHHHSQLYQQSRLDHVTPPPTTTSSDGFYPSTSSCDSFSSSTIDTLDKSATTNDDDEVMSGDQVNEKGDKLSRKHRKRRHSHSAPVVQRQAANLRERRRMQSINEAFEGLREHIPTLPYEKRLSKVDTLKLAIGYISFLTEMVNNEGNDPNDPSASAPRAPPPPKKVLLHSNHPLARGLPALSLSWSKENGLPLRGNVMVTKLWTPEDPRSGGKGSKGSDCNNEMSPSAEVLPSPSTPRSNSPSASPVVSSSSTSSTISPSSTASPPSTIESIEPNATPTTTSPSEPYPIHYPIPTRHHQLSHHHHHHQDILAEAVTSCFALY